MNNTYDIRGSKENLMQNGQHVVDGGHVVLDGPGIVVPGGSEKPKTLQPAVDGDVLQPLSEKDDKSHNGLPAPHQPKDHTDSSNTGLDKIKTIPNAPPPTPDNDENKPPPIATPVVHHIRPNQDDPFEEEGYKMRMYAVETDKENPAGRVINESSTNPAGNVITESSQPARTVSDEFVKVKSPKTNDKEVEEEEEEEEEGEEVVLPSLNKGRLQILKREDSDDCSVPNRKLESAENDVYTQAEPFVKGFVSGYHNVRRSKDKASLKNDVIQLDVPKNDPYAEAGQKLSEMAYDLELQHRTTIVQHVDKFFAELQNSNGGLEPGIKSILKNYKIIAEEIFRNGYTWSRFVVLLIFTFEIFQRLYAAYVPDLARNFLSKVSAVFVNIGLTAWLLAQGGLKKAASAFAKDSSKIQSAEKMKSECGCFFAQHMTAVGAAGAALAAGAAMAYYFLQRH